MDASGKGTASQLARVSTQDVTRRVLVGSLVGEEGVVWGVVGREKVGEVEGWMGGWTLEMKRNGQVLEHGG